MTADREALRTGRFLLIVIPLSKRRLNFFKILLVSIIWVDLFCLSNISDYLWELMADYN